MRIIDVTYRTQVPAGMTDDQILEWLRYTMDERGEIADDNPMNGCGLEPYLRSIRFQDVTNEQPETTRREYMPEHGILDTWQS